VSEDDTSQRLNARDDSSRLGLPTPRVAHADAQSGPPLPGDRPFGLTVGGILLAIAIFLFLYRGSWSNALAIPGGLLVLFALAYPRLLHPLNKLWAALGVFLGKVVTPVVMFLVFATALVPIGAVLRLLGKRPLGLTKQDVSTYWIVRSPPGPEPESLENQF